MRFWRCAHCAAVWLEPRAVGDATCYERISDAETCNLIPYCPMCWRTAPIPRRDP